MLFSKLVCMINKKLLHLVKFSRNSLIRYRFLNTLTVINNHIKWFFKLPNCTNASDTSMGDPLNNVTKHYRVLQALNEPFLQAFPIHAVTLRLDL